MVAPDYDGGFHFAAFHEIVEGYSGLLTLAHAKPADAGGQSLEGDFLTRHLQPAGKTFVFWKQLQQFSIGSVNILRVAGERYPTERAFPFTKQRTHIRRHKPRKIESILHAALVLRLPADVVAIVECNGAAL